jgi:hypothetical protein
MAGYVDDASMDSGEASVCSVAPGVGMDKQPVFVMHACKAIVDSGSEGRSYVSMEK